MKIKLEEVMDAFEESTDMSSHYLDVEKGEIIFFSEDDVFDEEEDYDTKLGEIEKELNSKYFAIPGQDSRVTYRDMEDFAETVKDENLKGQLFVALDGAGVFRRFKNVLLSWPEERERWFAFEYERKKARAIEWLQENKIEWE